MKSIKLLTLAIFSWMFFSCSHDNKPIDPVPAPAPIPIPAPVPPPAPAPIPAPVPPAPEKAVVHFKFNSSKLAHDQKDLIKKMLDSVAKDIPVHIVGFTDSQGSAKYNKHLSKKRALSVKRYLHTLGMKGKITYTGKGEADLLNADKTIAEHKLNRRAEVNFFSISIAEEKVEKVEKVIKKVHKVKKAHHVKAKAKKVKEEKKAEVKKEEVKKAEVKKVTP